VAPTPHGEIPQGLGESLKSYRRAGIQSFRIHPMISANPLLFEISARKFVESLKAITDSEATLADVPDEWFKNLADQGFDTVWLMGVWQLGEVGRKISLDRGRRSGEFERLLPGWTEADVSGSPYCVQDYRVHQDFGRDEALAVFRSKLREHGMGLVLDFVPNHTACDHRWVKEHPEYYVHGTPGLLVGQPDNYAEQDGTIFAHGRDPYFPGWPDVFQLDYRKELVQQAMMEDLALVSGLCDGVRCDMSMLVLPDIFAKTWGVLPDSLSREAAKGSFWSRAIDRVKEKCPDFKFIAEAYWGLEYRLQMEGFDYTYDKTLYDRLVHQNMHEIHADLTDWPPLARGVHFLENHDEPRTASAFPEPSYRQAAAVLTLSLPGVRLVYDGQIEGRKLRYCIHLRRAADVPSVENESSFYERLFQAVKGSVIGKGISSFIPSRPTWAGNTRYSDIQAILWEKDGKRDLVVVNLSGNECDTRLSFFFTGMGSRQWGFKNRLGLEEYTRSGDEIGTTGLYIKLLPYQAQIFELSRSQE